MATSKLQNEDNKRFRISIPNDDISVIEFLRRQSNVSFSIRVLIKDFISVHGYIDATCLADPSMGAPRRPGRPPAKLATQVADYGVESVPLPPVSASPVAEIPVSESILPASAMQSDVEDLSTDNVFFDPEDLLCENR